MSTDIFEDMDEDIKNIVDVDDIGEVTPFKLTNPLTVTEKDKKADVQKVADKTTHESFDIDFDYIRKNLKDIINSGAEALQNMILVASTSEHPRAYEVVATLMKALADVNKDLLHAHEKRDGRTTVPANKTTNTQNNTIFVGSTSELAKILKNKNQEIDVSNG